MTVVGLRRSTTGFKGVVSNDLSFASVEIDKKLLVDFTMVESLCHKWSRDQPQSGCFFQRPREAEKREPGNEVVYMFHKVGTH